MKIIKKILAVLTAFLILSMLFGSLAAGCHENIHGDIPVSEFINIMLISGTSLMSFICLMLFLLWLLIKSLEILLE